MKSEKLKAKSEKEPESDIIIEDAEVVPEPSELDKRKALSAEFIDKYQRLMAEFDNFRKRTAAEKMRIYDNAVGDTVARFLDVADNFERAVRAVRPEAQEDGFYKGVNMIFKQFTDVLDQIGVEGIDAEGEDFDPNLHEAVMHVEDGAFSEGEVVEEFQKGYMYKDKVIRHSKVKVAN